MSEPIKYEAAVAKMLLENKQATVKMKSHYPGCMSDETCKCQDDDDHDEWLYQQKMDKIEQNHDFLGERDNQENEEE